MTTKSVNESAVTFLVLLNSEDMRSGSDLAVKPSAAEPDLIFFRNIAGAGRICNVVEQLRGKGRRSLR